MTQLTEDVKTKVQENVNAASEKISSATGSAKEWASEASNAIKQKISSATNAADVVVEDGQKTFS